MSLETGGETQPGSTPRGNASEQGFDNVERSGKKKGEFGRGEGKPL